MRIAFALVLLGSISLFSPRADAVEFLDCFKAATNGNNEAEYASAVKTCTQLLDMGKKWTNMDRTRLFGNRANAYIKWNKLDLAMADLDRAIALTPDYVFAYDDRGDVWRKRGEYDKALKEYDRALAIDPKFLSARYERGEVFEKMGNVPSARTEYQMVIDAPDSTRPIDKWAKDQAGKALERLK